MAGTPVHVKDTVGRVVLETLSTSQRGAQNSRLTGLKTMILRSMENIMTSSEFISNVSDSVIDTVGFILSVAELFKSEQQKLVTEQVKIQDRCRQCLEAETEMDPNTVPMPSKGSVLRPTDLSDDKTNSRAHLI